MAACTLGIVGIRRLPMDQCGLRNADVNMTGLLWKILVVIRHFKLNRRDKMYKAFYLSFNHNQMKKAIVTFFLSLIINSAVSQLKYAKISAQIKEYEDTSNIFLALYRSENGGKLVQVKKISIRNAIIGFKLTTPEPFFCDVKLLRGDSIIAGASSFLVTNADIKIIFDKTKKLAEIHGGENDFYFKNRFLLFAIPYLIKSYPSFSCKALKESYDIETNDIRLRYYWAEYENNIIDQVAARKNYYSILMGLYSAKDCFTLKGLEKCYLLLSDTLKRTSYGKLLGEYIVNSKKTFPGELIPDFSVLDTEGNRKTSKEIVGNSKYTLIDFWASWCLPCREQMKELKKNYNLIDTSKLQFISISIDEHKARWEQAIKYDEILWKNFIDTLGWSGEIVRKFALEAIPQNKIIDQNGRIVAFNLNGEKLLEFFRNRKLTID
jgi:peroxiredoxin